MLSCRATHPRKLDATGHSPYRALVLDSRDSDGCISCCSRATRGRATHTRRSWRRGVDRRWPLLGHLRGAERRAAARFATWARGARQCLFWEGVDVRATRCAGCHPKLPFGADEPVTAEHSRRSSAAAATLRDHDPHASLRLSRDSSALGRRLTGGRRRRDPRSVSRLR